jgi:hypothetical protein
MARRTRDFEAELDYSGHRPVLGTAGEKYAQFETRLEIGGGVGQGVGGG